VSALLSVMNARVYAAVRNYVHDTGALISLDAKEGHQAYYAALLHKYEIVDVTMMDRLVQDDYVFCELRFVARDRAQDVTRTFHTAEFFVPGRDGRFAVRIGHGTDAAPI
jgi:hypothetical protein